MHEARERKETGPLAGAFAPEIPNSKIQIPRKFQIPTINGQRTRRFFGEFGAWVFFGVWELELGASRGAGGLGFGIWDFRRS
jgi:hypothetical protein